MPQGTVTNESFDSAFQRDALARIWEELKQAKTEFFSGRIRIAPGWDRRTLRVFEKQLPQHLAAIERKARSGRYTFRPFLYRHLAKADGSKRKISYSGIADRIVQGALHNLVAEAVEPLLTDSAFAYRRGRGTYDALRAVYDAGTGGFPWLVESDFQKFFDTLNHDRLQALIGDLQVDERARQLCWRFVRTGELPDKSVGQDQPTQVAKPKRPVPESRKLGVPQGGVVSGVLANLYLAEFDRLIRGGPGRLVRYADDFVVLCRTREDCELVRSALEAAVKPLALELHPEKTHYGRHINDGLEFVGFRLRGTLVSVKPANLRRFKRRIVGLVEEMEHRYKASQFPSSKAALDMLIWRINRKIEGVQADGVHRSWIQFFRVVNDEQQVRRLDRWLWRSVSGFAVRHKLGNPSRASLRRLGLRSLLGEYWACRRRTPTLSFPFTGFVPP